MLPLRAISESVGANVDWNPNTQTVSITTNRQNQVATTQTPQQTTPTQQVHIVTPVEPSPVQDRSITPVLFNSPTLLSSAELLALQETAPSHIETRSNIKLPNRRITDAELQSWIQEYRNLGGINSFELEIVRLINEVRAEHGLASLKISQELSMAARFHSQEMVDLNYFSHTSPHHGSAVDRMVMFGHDEGLGENIAGTGGFDPTPKEHIDIWLNSPGHRRVILHSQEIIIGIGVANNDGSTYSTLKYGF
jgi:uncharacterized protein YkwD